MISPFTERLCTLLEAKYGFHVGEMRKEAFVHDVETLLANRSVRQTAERNPAHTTVRYACGCEATGMIDGLTLHCRKHGAAHEPTAEILIAGVKPPKPTPAPEPEPAPEPDQDEKE